MADGAKKIGTITHYYSKLGVGIVKLSGQLKVGDTVRISGKSTSHEQLVQEMQLEHKDIKVAKKGQEVGIKVLAKVHEGNEVYLLG